MEQTVRTPRHGNFPSRSRWPEIAFSLNGPTRAKISVLGRRRKQAAPCSTFRGLTLLRYPAKARTSPAPVLGAIPVPSWDAVRRNRHNFLLLLELHCILVLRFCPMAKRCAGLRRQDVAKRQHGPGMLQAASGPNTREFGVFTIGEAPYTFPASGRSFEGSARVAVAIGPAAFPPEEKVDLRKRELGISRLRQNRKELVCAGRMP